MDEKMRELCEEHQRRNPPASPPGMMQLALTGLLAAPPSPPPPPAVVPAPGELERLRTDNEALRVDNEALRRRVAELEGPVTTGRVLPRHELKTVRHMLRVWQAVIAPRDRAGTAWRSATAMGDAKKAEATKQLISKS